MKKITLLTATVLSVTAFAGQPMTTQAAAKNQIQTYKNGNRYVITYRDNCNIQGLLDKLQACFPNISLPECELPEADFPNNNQPDTNVPDYNTPEADLPDNTPDTNVPGTDNDNTEDTENASFAMQVVTLVNKERAKAGLAPLTINNQVQSAAQIRAKECELSFSHTRPDGRHFVTALQEQNVSYRGAGENIAWGQRSPEEVVNAWMNSAGHRANILNSKFTTIGVGHYQNSRGTNYWAQLFTY